jgi:tetratricopeptide (TPR) repeat protein
LGSRFCSNPAIVVLICALICINVFGADPVEAVFQQAASALSSQDYPAAEHGFQSVLKSQPNNVAALGNLGVVYSRTHRYAEAIEVYRRALRIAPGDKGLTTNLGLAYVKQERYAPALPLFEKLAADPQNLQAREMLAACHLSLGQLEPAVAVLEPLQATDPKNAGVLYMLGVALTRLKRTDEAHAAFAKMMDAVSPAQANFLMGKASYETGSFEEAAAFLRQALKADPELKAAHRELGKTLVSLRDNDGAEKELRQAGSDDAEALYFLGAVLAQAQQAEAIPILTKAQALNPDFWGPLYYLGRIHLEQDHPKQALVFLERAAKLNPDEPAIQYQLGGALRKAGREAEARAAFARVKQLKAASLKSEIDVLSPLPTR